MPRTSRLRWLCAGLATTSLALSPAAIAQASPVQETGELMNYVVNATATGTTAKSEAAIKAAGGTVVQSWPQIGVVVAQ